MSKQKKFSFKSFCKNAGISHETIDVLTRERLDDEFTLVRLDFDTLQSLELCSGDIYRLEYAIGNLVDPVKAVKKTKSSGNGRRSSVGDGTFDGGAVGGAVGGTLDDDEIESLRCVQELKDIQEQCSRKKTRGKTVDDNAFPDDSKLVTTKTLSKDERVSALLAQYLGSDDISGISNLLSLSKIQLKSTVDTGKKGEKPLFICDFLSSNINTLYSSIDSNEEKITLSEKVKIVLDNDYKKPKVTEYTPELWCAANSRALLYLVLNGATRRTVLEYVDYSAIIGDYLCMYQHKGVFSKHQRKRVAIETRAWNDICSHDENKFLKYEHSKDNEYSSTVTSDAPKSKPKSKGSTRRKVVKDDDGKSVCWNFNSKRGCDLSPCKHTHVCIDCFGKHSSLDCKR